jgi:hypothetical protein
LPNAGLNATRDIQTPPGGGVLQLLITGMAGDVFIDRRCVVDRVKGTRCVICSTRQLFNEDDGMEF